MFLTLAGIIVLLLPFSLVLAFPDRRKGFLSMLVAVFSFHLVLAIVTQATNTFSFWTIFFSSLSFGLITLFLAVKKKVSVTGAKINLFVLSIFLTSFLLLYSVHFNYTGSVVSIQGYTETSNSTYPYPMYSDEWIAVALANLSISENTLPLFNPLHPDATFLNFLVAFHSLVAEIFLLLNLAPLTGYAWITIASGMLISVCIYFMLRYSKVGEFASALSAVSIFFITNSGNFPSTWSFIPYHLSLVFVLVAIASAMMRSNVLSAASIILALIFYPPIVVFAVPIFIGAYLKNGSIHKALLESRFVAICVLVAVALFSLWLTLSVSFSSSAIFSRAASFLVRDSLEVGIISFMPWNVLPIFLLPFIFFGIFRLLKERMFPISLPIVTGIVLWVIYGYIEKVILIEPSRVVAITAVLLVAVAGFGIDSLLQFAVKKYPILLSKSVRNILKVLAVIIFTILSLYAARLNRWDKIPLIVRSGGEVRSYSPAPPVTRYLTEDDLRLFAGIEGKIFVAPAWKGLVVAASTGNFPLESKYSTISNSFLRYSDFMNADCGGKVRYAIRYKVNYVYSSPFSCKEFIEKGKSNEELVLYQFEGQN
jgi:phosphatidylglycerophosphatase A